MNMECQSINATGGAAFVGHILVAKRSVVGTGNPSTRTTGLAAGVDAGAELTQVNVRQRALPGLSREPRSY